MSNNTWTRNPANRMMLPHHMSHNLVKCAIEFKNSRRTWPEMCNSHFIIHLFQGASWIDYRSIWCRDFTIICITKQLEVKMPAYTSFISDVHITIHLKWRSVLTSTVIVYSCHSGATKWNDQKFYLHEIQESFWPGGGVILTLLLGGSFLLL